MSTSHRVIGATVSLAALFACSLAVRPLVKVASGTTTAPRPEFVYVALSEGYVAAFEIGTDGALTPVPGSPFPAGSSPNGVAVDPTGKVVYVANVLSDDVSGYTINADGSLTPVPASPVPAGSGPASVTVDPLGRFVFVGNCGAICSGSGSGSISVYSINRRNGALTPVAEFTAGQWPEPIAVSPSGEFLYAGNYGSANVSDFSISSTGELTPVAGSPFSAGSSPLSVFADPLGSFLYVANTASSNVSAYTIEADGALTQISGSPFGAASFTASIQTDPAGKHAFVAVGAGVLAYTISTTGALVAVAGSPFPAGTGPNSLSVDRTGRYVYVANAGSGTISAFTINPRTGALTAVAGSPFPTGGRPESVATSPGPR